ncbi:MAG: hypothetical protein IJN24_02600 [Bacteroidaceae bacterium]|nr:hypothetical protein [Bacteroidaceae bacterium]
MTPLLKLYNKSSINSTHKKIQRQREPYGPNTGGAAAPPPKPEGLDGAPPIIGGFPGRFIGGKGLKLPGAGGGNIGGRGGRTGRGLKIGGGGGGAKNRHLSS